MSQKLIEIKNEKNNYYNLYNEQKILNYNLSKKINEIKEDFNEYKMENSLINENKKNKEESKKEKINMKKQLLSDIKRRIQSYKLMQKNSNNIDEIF